LLFNIFSFSGDVLKLDFCTVVAFQEDKKTEMGDGGTARLLYGRSCCTKGHVTLTAERFGASRVDADNTRAANARNP